MEKEIFKNENFKYISKYVEKKLPILRKNKEFETKYIRLTNAINNISLFDNFMKVEYFVRTFKARSELKGLA